jgi:hypothetical protein
MDETVTRWSVEIYLSEIDGRSHAEARLVTGVEPGLTATGTAKLSTHDKLDVPEVGFEIATSRALHALGESLMDVAMNDVEALAL